MKKIILLAACISNAAFGAISDSSKSKKPAIKKEVLPELTISSAIPDTSYRATTTKFWEITHTRLAISFNLEERTAPVKELIDLHPYCYATDSLVLDAKSVAIDSVSMVEVKKNTPLRYDYRDDQLIVHFPQPIRSDNNIKLYLKYTAQPYAKKTGGSAAIRDDRGLYFINTDHKVPNKPVQIWTQGETEANSHWMVTIDKPNTRFTTELEITAPDSMKTLSNGALVKKVQFKNGFHTDYWKMDQPIQAYVVMMAVGNFAIVKDKWRGKDMDYYVEPEYAPYARTMFEHTGEMLSFFSDYTGVPYPWNKYSQVVVRDYVSGAMENTSATLHGEFLNQNFREHADKNSEDVVSHELFHQWFGDYVTAESWSNLTVNESFANYGEQLWRRHFYGKDYAEELAYNDLNRFLGGFSWGKKKPLVRFHYGSREEMFDGITYNKGGAILHYIHGLIGDEAFRKSIKIYLTKNALQSAEAHNWRMAVEEATGQDWTEFFNEFYYKGGFPELKIKYKAFDTASKLRVIVRQVHSDSSFNYHLKLNAEVMNGGKSQIVQWVVNDKCDTFWYDYQNGVAPFIFPDFDHIFPGKIEENKKGAQWFAQLEKGRGYATKHRALEFFRKNKDDDFYEKALMLGLSDNNKAIRQYAVELVAENNEGKLENTFKGRIFDIAKSDTIKAIRAEAIRTLGNWKRKEDVAQFENCVYDSSYNLAGATLSAIMQCDTPKAYSLARKMVATDIRGGLKYAVWQTLAISGKEEDVNLFYNQAKSEGVTKGVYFEVPLTEYIKAVKSTSVYAKGFSALLLMYQREEGGFAKRMCEASLLGRMLVLRDGLKSEKQEEMAKAKERAAAIKSYVQQLIDGSKEEDDKKKWTEEFKKLYE